MGQLTFQATLGGAVNLVGPNTASTTSFTLPSADGTSGQALTTNGSGTLAFGTLAVGAGGTGQTSYTDGQLLIGNSTGNTLTKATLTAGSNITITNAAGAITIAATGGGSAATPTALGTVYGSTLDLSGNATTAVGFRALNSNTGSSNVAVGATALYTNTSGARSTAIGYSAMYNSNASDNTGVGTYALLGNTSGASNTAIGSDALRSNTTGAQNTALGYQAAYNNTISNGNVAVGYQAMANSNRTADNDNYSIAVGYQALYGMTTGANNTVVGRDAARTGTDFGGICAFGRDALRSATGGNNSAFGYSAGRQLTTGSVNCFFGLSSASATAITGSSNNGYGNEAFNSLTSGSSNNAFGQYAGYSVTSGSNNLFFGSSSGRTGSPGGQIDTQDNRICMGNGNVTNAYIQVSWTVTSDARDKTDVVDAKYGLDFIKGLRPVEFKWDKRANYFKGISDGTHKESKTQLGFLAQDVIALEKQHGGVAKDLLIADDEKEEEIVSITETKFIPVLVKAFQELSAKFDQLKAEHDAYVVSHP